MSILLNYHLQEQISHTDSEFAATYYHDELNILPNWTGPLHCHTDFEIATAVNSTLDFQLGHHNSMDK